MGFEFKLADAPRMTSVTTQTLKNLQLDRLWVVYPGDKRYTLGEKTEALPLSSVFTPNLVSRGIP